MVFHPVQIIQGMPINYCYIHGIKCVQIQGKQFV